MDELQKLFDQRLDTIQKCKDFCDLAAEKYEIIDQLQELKRAVDDKKKALNETKRNIYEFQNNDRGKVEKLIENGHKQMLSMLHIMSELTDRTPPTVDKENDPNELNKPTPMLLSKNFQTPNSRDGKNSMQPITPRLLLSDYLKSPYSRRIKPVQLQFLDFETSITAETFAKIPAYLRGRDTLADLLNFLENTIIRCFTDKYTLAYKDRDAIRNLHDVEQWKLYRSQEFYFPGRRFITQGDVSALLNRQIDKKTSGRIQMLRHLQIIKETRHKSTTCYIWNLQ